MENLFFNTNYSNFEQTLIKLLLFIAISGLLLYFLFFILSKLLFKKSKNRREITLRITFLWALFIFFIVYNIYVLILFYQTGINNMNFVSGRFYLGIFPQIIIYVAILAFFFIKRYNLKEIINKSTLN